MSGSSIFPSATHQCRGNHWLTALCLAVCVIPEAQALDPHRPIRRYIRDHWTADQGYAGGAVNTFAQTRDEYLWIGAENGLVRFDGLTFQLFNYTNTPAFPASAVMGLQTDAQGTLWVLLESREILRYRRGRFELMPDMAGVTAIGRGTGHDILLSRANRVVRIRNGRPAGFTVVPGYTERLAISIAEAGDGTVWVGTRDTGLYGLRGGKALEPRPSRNRKVNCLLAAFGGVLWVGTDQGLFRWNGNGLTASGVPMALQQVQVLAVARDHDANLWLGTAHGLVRMTARGDFSEIRSGAHAADPVRAVFEDREGNLWIGRTNGIERYRDSVFLTYFSSAKGSDDSRPIYVDQAGRTWFGPSSGGLYYMKNGMRTAVEESGLDRDVIYSIDGGPGELWVGRQRGGLTRLRIEGSPAVVETFTASQGLAAGPVYAVHRNRDGTVWAGTLGGGVSCLRGGRLTSYTEADGLASNRISAIEEGADGTMWIATSRGLNSFAHGRWRAYTNQDGIPPGRIDSLWDDSAGVLWIGTQSGLVFLREGQIQMASNVPESLLGEILGVVDDGSGWLWVSTSKHVVRVSRAHAAGELPGPGAMREFGEADGIPVPQGVRRSRSVVRDAEGRIWFSLQHGISVIDPERVGAKSVPAIVHIKSVSAGGSPLGHGTQYRIPASRRRIRFEFLGVSLSVPDRVRYRYRLDGFDNSWSEPSSAHEAVYTNLSPGSYTFRVTASNSEGIWNSSGAVVRVEIVPAFWQTRSFQALILLICAFAVLAIYRMRLRRAMERLGLRFEERLAERTRIAQELHDTLLQGLVSASMQLHVAIGKLPADSPARPYFTRTTELMRQVVDESRNAVQGLRSSASNGQDLEEAFSKVRTEFGEAEPKLRIVVDGRSRPLNPLIRDEVYRIGREALSNAFRHSGAATVEMEIQYGENDLRLAVRDSGRGIDEQVLQSGREGHWGLIGMRERAEKIGANLRVWSRISAGTELKLTVPGHVAFPKAETPLRRTWLRRWIHREAGGKRMATGQEKS